MNFVFIILRVNEVSHPWNPDKAMQVCEVCGSYLIIGEAQHRLDDHIMGKQHMGFALLRKTKEDVMLARETRQIQEEKERQSRRFGGGSGSSRDRDRVGDAVIDRDRDRRDLNKIDKKRSRSRYKKILVCFVYIKIINNYNSNFNLTDLVIEGKEMTKISEGVASQNQNPQDGDHVTEKIAKEIGIHLGI
jgi:hypothetical protein